MDIEKTNKIDGYEKYELENCVDTIFRAEEIKADKKKMKALAPFLEKKLKGYKRTIESLSDIKAYKEEQNEEE